MQVLSQIKSRLYSGCPSLIRQFLYCFQTQKNLHNGVKGCVESAYDHTHKKFFAIHCFYALLGDSATRISTSVF
jgi:hypothetical protein